MTLRNLICAALVATVVGSPLAAAQDRATAPFVGTWTGGPATCDEPFRFSPDRYTPPGGQQIRVAAVERDGDNYLLTFRDGYRVALFDVGRRTMTWHSPISGDTFELRRCR